MKKILALVLAFVMVLGMVACGGPKEPQISVFWYDESDVYLSSVRTALNAELDKLGIKYDNQFAATIRLSSWTRSRPLSLAAPPC